ncbi:uncharacterized protein LOC126908008 isoform X2 [Daktulosphaira vitifoliae]|uniref:uncharacterized protein LOC126908008 isoform X2 n=1 Tax=Daktulosphaira vitifoliae TaxID=58002 RepID=UPI0021AAD58D|nr:uncharacterized protein LOC126908008 isoform X2 [Daktulosphaira vitifoliae]
MIQCKIFYIFVLMINFSTAMEYMELNCNFSKYILNYFKHNEKYLLKLEEDKTNISKRDLKMYGKAIQSHGEIVIAMLEALKSEVRPNYPSTLMDVNLYLNNVSGSVEMNFKNKNDRLCSQNIYTEIYNIEDSESVDDKKTTINTLYHDNVNNTKQTNNQNATDSTKNKNPLPSYMIDYILFI